jgi:hypothetical protein
MRSTVDTALEIYHSLKMAASGNIAVRVCRQARYKTFFIGVLDVKGRSALCP